MFEIEDKKVTSDNGRDSEEFRQFLEALKVMSVGQSIWIKKVPSHYRLAMSISRTLIGAHFSAKKDGAGFRVGRIA